jgi:hypothetical protein
MFDTGQILRGQILKALGLVAGACVNLPQVGILMKRVYHTTANYSNDYIN